MRQKKPSHNNTERWLLTYSDLITLLMVLFVMLYAMSNVNTDKYEQLAVSLSNALGGNTGILQNSSAIASQTGEKAGDVSKDPNVLRAQANSQGDKSNDLQLGQSITTKSDMQKLKQLVDQILAQNNLTSVVSTSMQVTGLVITFPDNVFFDSGQDVLKDDMKQSLSQITVILNKIDNSILVEGYTDNLPIKKGAKYASNWQLSAMRASNVVQYLVDNCNVNSARLSAIGHGENDPIANNNTVDGRSKNRRIELTILYDSKLDSQQTTNQKVKEQGSDT